MTSQIRHYVDLADIVAIRCQCGECGATVSLPISREFKTRGIQTCPACNEPWAAFPQGSNMESKFQDVAHGIKELEAALHRVKEGFKVKGVLVSLEIKPEAFSISASGRDADKTD